MEVQMMDSRKRYHRLASLVEKIIMSAILLCHLSAGNGQAMDSDRDGIDDGIEYALARSFLPRIWYKDDAICTDPGVIAYHVSPYVPGGSNSMIEIAYTVLYYYDCGWLSGHDFDDETFAITVKYDETLPLSYHYGVRSIKTVAHMGTDCQKTEEDYYQDLVPSPGFTDGPQYVGDYWRSIYSSRSKHGNFLNEGSCHQYCDDSCNSAYVMNVDMNGLVPPDAGQLFHMVNVGEVNNHLVDDLEDIDNLFVGVDFTGEIGNRSLWSPSLIHHHYMASPGKPGMG